VACKTSILCNIKAPRTIKIRSLIISTNKYYFYKAFIFEYLCNRIHIFKFLIFILEK
jgi:hypothetical protein